MKAHQILLQIFRCPFTLIRDGSRAAKSNIRKIFLRATDVYLGNAASRRAQVKMRATLIFVRRASAFAGAINRPEAPSSSSRRTRSARPRWVKVSTPSVAARTIARRSPSLRRTAVADHQPLCGRRLGHGDRPRFVLSTAPGFLFGTIFRRTAVQAQKLPPSATRCSLMVPRTGPSLKPCGSFINIRVPPGRAKSCGIRTQQTSSLSY